jgi:hypothetical protein
MNAKLNTSALQGALTAALLWLCACGPVMYGSSVDKAETALEQAREQNAHWYAPYEYHYAQAHLDKAYEEAAHADYEDAVRFAKTARDYAERALRMAARQRIEDR